MATLLIRKKIVFCNRPIETILQGMYVTAKKTKWVY